MSKIIFSKTLKTMSAVLIVVLLGIATCLVMIGAEETDTLKKIRTQILSVGHSPFAQEYMKELEALHAHENKPADTSIEYIFVLSGRGSYLKNPVDGPDIKDREDDYNRIELGIKIAQDVISARLKTQKDTEKKDPIIIYNGRPKHNEDLKLALEQGILSHYPKDNFHIMEIEEQSTRGQFKNLKEDFPISNASVALISHAYHFPRIGRMVGSKWHPFGKNTKVFAYLVDRELKAPGIIEDIQGEIDRVPVYIGQGDLNSSISKDIIF